MDINEYKTALKNMIDAMDDENVLRRWKSQLETEFEQYRKSASGTAGENSDKDDNEGYVVLESGLGIDE